MTPLEQRLEDLRRLQELRQAVHESQKGVDWGALGQSILDQGKAIGTSLLRGGAKVLNTVIPGGEMARAFVPGVDTRPGDLPVDPRKLPPAPPILSKGDAYRNVIFEAAPWAALGGVNAARALIPAMASGAGGQAGGDVAEQFIGADPRIKATGQLLGSLALGVPYSAMGSASRRSPVSAAEQTARDQGILTNIGLDRIGPRVDPAQVANRASGAANNFERQLSEMGTRAFQGELVGAPNIRGITVGTIYEQLQTAARNHPDPVMSQAYSDVARTLLDKSGARYITDPDILSAALKRFQQTPNAQNPTASAGQKFSTSQEHSRIASWAEQQLGDLYFPLARANQASRDFRRDVADPLRESPMGTLADANPRRADPTPVGRLESAVSTSSPEGVRDLLRLLENQGVPAQEIARAVAQRRLQGGSARPEKAVFGQPFSPQEGQTEALLQGNASRVRAPLQAAETLGRIEGESFGTGAYGRLDPTNPGASGIRFVMRPGFLQKIKDKGIYDQQVQNLLQSASHQELQMLMQLSKFDPQLKAALGIYASGVAPVLNQE